MEALRIYESEDRAFSVKVHELALRLRVLVINASPVM